MDSAVASNFGRKNNNNNNKQQQTDGAVDAAKSQEKTKENVKQQLTAPLRMRFALQM
jgi:hypothetical protein